MEYSYKFSYDDHFNYHKLDPRSIFRDEYYNENNIVESRFINAR